MPIGTIKAQAIAQRVFVRCLFNYNKQKAWRTAQLPDAIWSYRLNATELKVYLALQKFANTFGRCTVKHSTIAQLVGASEESVSRAARKLADSGLLCIHERQNSITRNRIANGYTVETPAGGYTKLPASIFACALDKSVFKVYA